MLRDIKKTRTLLRQFRAFQCLKKRQRLRHRDRLDTLLIKTDKRIHNLTRALARTPDSPCPEMRGQLWCGWKPCELKS
ncbi:hypothetical protein AAIA72_09995 [Hahella sp. SMD15-11]|uniref:CHAD domain-containing protein n=1 Tax=Thermohahella caldifontis TaxID=3142973 RepID=A0AB39USA9_9GAMM